MTSTGFAGGNGTMLLRVSPQGLIVAMNGEAAVVLGPSAIGMPCHEVVCAVTCADGAVCSSRCVSALRRRATGMQEHDGFVRDQRVRVACAALGDDVVVAVVPTWEPEDMVHMCAWCREIGDEEGHWMSAETFLAVRFGQMVSHGICPGCATLVEQEPHQ